MQLGRVTSGTLRSRACVLVALTMLSCEEEGVGPSFDDPIEVTLEPVVTGLFRPLFLTAPPNDDRLFVVQQNGLIRIVRNGSVDSVPFLDIHDLVSGGGEQGLLGLAFHPRYGSNGYFYVNYTDTLGHTQVVRYRVSSDPDVADEGSGLPILTVQQPYANHNGGMLAFGPNDGMLYVGMGDGGSGGDPQGHGQNRMTLLGDMLRLDVDGGTPYAIPSDNPYEGSLSVANEIWASGLRNPWRFSFDRETGDLYIGDVGQNAWEEISFQPASSHGGENYGWAEMEGTHCYPPGASCSQSGLTLPVYEYDHSDGCSVAGGYVYRGTDFPSLRGRYFFADLCASWLRSFGTVNGEARGFQDHTASAGAVSSVVSFGEDGRGELYVVSHGGSIQRIVVP
jgi:glucose/arabinose dehydrogenase